MNFGRPCSINDTDWEVKMVCNIDDTSITCPGFQSMEALEDGSVERVTILSYRRCKYKLYQIVSTILKSVYFTKGITIEETAQKVKAINEQLLAWERDVPPELRLTSFKPDTIDVGGDRVLQTFQLQALALHLFYNNIQLLLHRPLLTYTGLPRQSRKLTTASGKSSSLVAEAPPSTTNFDVELYQLSKNKSWESATQTTKIGEYKNLLLAAHKTLVAPYIGIQSFTAGAVLGLFALSAPLTAISQEAKRSLGRLIKLPQNLGSHNLVSDQCGNILKELVHLILSEEMRSLTSDMNNDMGEQSSNNASVQPMQPMSRAWESTQSSADNAWSSGEYDRLTSNSISNPQGHHPNMANTLHSPRPLDVVERNEDAFVYDNEALRYQDCFPATAAEDFNHALLSLQTGMSALFLQPKSH